MILGPNITGGTDLGGFSGKSTQPTGAFYQSYTALDGYTLSPEPASDTQLVVVSFDANRSNPIYGRSQTVQPPAMRAMALIKT